MPIVKTGEAPTPEQYSEIIRRYTAGGKQRASLTRWERERYWAYIRLADPNVFGDLIPEIEWPPKNVDSGE